jgi:hypothetical protein
MAVVVLRGRGGLATVFPASRRRFIRPGRAGRFARRFGGLMRRGPGERRPSSGFARERSPLQLGSAWWRRPPVEAQLVHVLSAAPRDLGAVFAPLFPVSGPDWSPGYDARDDVPDVLASLQGPRATAALRYYRAFLLPWMRAKQYAAEQSHLLDVPPAPLLYLHGERDGCQLPAIASRAGDFLRQPSRFEMVRRPRPVTHPITGADARGNVSTACSRSSTALD